MADTEYNIMQTRADKQIKLNIIDSGNSTDILKWEELEFNGSNNEISLL